MAPLPYETAHMGPLMQLVDNMAETGRRIGGTAEVQVGEGRADVPVGTVMAMIDQAVKVMNAVHKRMHAAQAEEFQLLREVMREHIDAFLEVLKRHCKSKTQWDRAKLESALNNCDLVPQADPNTSSSGQRLMKIMALFQLADKQPTLYDPLKMHTAALNAIGWANPAEFFVPPQAQSNPPPQLVQMQAQMKNEEAEAQAKVIEANARAAEAKAKAADVQAKIDTGHYAPKGEGAAAGPESPPTDTPVDVALAQAKILDSHTHAQEVGLKSRELDQEDRVREADAAAKERETAIGLASDVIRAPTNEAGRPTGVAGAGQKASKIIADVDKSIKRE